ncbi:MAG: magnesium transporter [Simkaniaceae bacterium]|nr:magnesium transporter [Simkaniaceae bacterium]
MSQKDLSRQVKDFVSPVTTLVHINQTIEQALVEIRSHAIREKIIYFYVINDANQLQGVVSTRKLLLEDPKKMISAVLEKKMVCLKGSQTLREAMEFLELHHLLALPVVDDEGRLLGVVNVDLYVEDSWDIANGVHRSDIFQMFGMYVGEGKGQSLFVSYRNRMLWIFCNMFGGLACAAISAYFEVVLSRVLLFAMFIPLILTLSESISMQSLTQSMQLIHGRKSGGWHHWMDSLLREWRIILFMGLSCGVVIGFASLLWKEGWLPSLIIGISNVVGVLISAIIGSLVPLVIHRLHWDPKVAAGPVVLMFADVLTTTLYLGLATWILI